MLSRQPFEVPAAQLARVAKGRPKRIAVAGAASDVVLESVRQALAAGFIEPVLVGEGSAIQSIAEKIGLDLGGLEVVDSATESDIAAKSVELARSGQVEVLMKGSIHTDTLMRAVIDRDNGLRTKNRMSHIFQMTFPGHDSALYITDAALNVAPDVPMRLAITRNAVQLLNGIGIEKPRVAILSAVEVATQTIPSSMEAAEIATLAAEAEMGGAIVEGPLSMDLAISPEAAAIKGIESPVAGQADLIVVPNIETGNAIFKTLVYFRSAAAAGLVLGAKTPIILTSRADPPEARLAAIALAMTL